MSTMNGTQTCTHHVHNTCTYQQVKLQGTEEEIAEMRSQFQLEKAISCLLLLLLLLSADPSFSQYADPSFGASFTADSVWRG